nr:polysaccharide pyruvyl transferase family protein [uncultured Draconibacterium sp.]
MKIGILTHWWSEDNYGQQLQCFALQKYLRDAGHEPFLIRYYPKRDNLPSFLVRIAKKIINPVLLYRVIIDNLEKFCKNQSSRLRMNFSRNFEAFRKNNISQSEIIYYSYNELKKNPPVADVYIVGSDQVWGLNARDISKGKDRLNAWFLNFGSENIMRLSYAASWGDKEISEEQIEEISPLLKKFRFVGVRELSGVSVCKQCGVEDAKWMLDPTFLFQAKDYRTLFKDLNMKDVKKEYIVFYWLNNGTKNPIEEVLKWASDNNFAVKYITGNNEREGDFAQEYASIEEWLYLIDNAKYVVTNSYHCCIFSLLFHTPFGVVPLEGDMGRLNERMSSLFLTLNIEPRFIEGQEFNIIKANIDFEKIDNKLVEIREESSFLEILTNK